MVSRLLIFLIIFSVSSCATLRSGRVYFESIANPTECSAYVINSNTIDTLIHNEVIEENMVLGLAKSADFSYRGSKPYKLRIVLDSLVSDIELVQLPHKPAIIIDYNNGAFDWNDSIINNGHRFISISVKKNYHKRKYY